MWDGQKTGIDIQVGNQYIVVPPSIHPDTGQAYQWHVEPCAVNELPVLPSDWVEYVLPHRQPKKSLIVPETKQLIVPRSGSALS
ncbi:MAG: bifunctional DNA primase/polymerase, partial [Planctomycetaceae bacterium]|nr:bifunctional DNA primase/polymerase [Planctomycetaceae bacterium]